MIKRRMMVSLSLEDVRVLAKARENVARGQEEVRLRNSTRLWAHKAWLACRQAFEHDERLNSRYQSESDRKKTRERRRAIEAELQRLADGLWT
jgi:hypothetical protein